MPTSDASKYDKLDASKELEQQLYADLQAAFECRGCTITHHGTPTMCAPGGKPDLVISDPANGRLILVEVTRRKGAAADGEFLEVKDHLEAAIAAGGYTDYCCFFVSPRTSARMSASIRDLYNRTRERDGKPGRVIPVDFGAFEMLLRKMAESDPQLYPAERFSSLFNNWAQAADDIRTRHLIAQTVLSEDTPLIATLTQEMKALDAERELRLKKAIEHLENRLRHSGITGNAANTALVFLTFMRLYEEKRQRERREENRFTVTGFEKWTATLPKQTITKNKGRLVEVLLREIAEDDDLKAAGLLQDERLRHRPTRPRRHLQPMWRSA